MKSKRTNIIVADPEDISRDIEASVTLAVRKLMAEHKALLTMLQQSVSSMKPWLTKEEAAGYLGIAPSTFDEWRKMYGIPSRKRGQQLYFKRDDLDNLIASEV